MKKNTTFCTFRHKETHSGRLIYVRRSVYDTFDATHDKSETEVYYWTFILDTFCVDPSQYITKIWCDGIGGAFERSMLRASVCMRTARLDVSDCLRRNSNELRRKIIRLTGERKHTDVTRLNFEE